MSTSAISHVAVGSSKRSSQVRITFTIPQSNRLGTNNGFYLSLFIAAPSSVHDHSRVILIFFGIDTISTIRLNGQVLGRTDNMFVRYQYDVKDALLASGEMNSLVVDIENPIQAASDLASKNSFTPPNCPPAAYHGECHMNFLRKMQASFAWDWGLAAPSVGLWKDVQLQVFDVATIRDVTIAAMELKSANWHLRFNVYLDTDSPSSSISGELEVLFPGINNSKVTKSVESQSDGQGELVVDVDFDLAEEDVELWWPNGAGLPTLYDVNVSFTPKQQQQQQPHQQGQANEKDTKTFRIGFRTIKLVQEPIGEEEEEKKKRKTLDNTFHVTLSLYLPPFSRCRLIVLL